MNTLISQRSKTLERINSQPKPPRGKRLKNTTGINITNDEFLMIMMEKQEQKNQQKKPTRSSAQSSTDGASNSVTNVTKRRGRPPKKNEANTQATLPHSDPATEAAYSSLQSVINMSNRIFNDSDSD
jgi:hypothetical protein